jgi:predicted RNA-binding protein with RPS1 domain
MKKNQILGKIPVGKHGAVVLTETGQTGIIHHKQIDHNGNYFVYPMEGETLNAKPEKFEIVRCF